MPHINQSERWLTHTISKPFTASLFFFSFYKATQKKFQPLTTLECELFAGDLITLREKKKVRHSCQVKAWGKKKSDSYSYLQGKINY